MIFVVLADYHYSYSTVFGTQAGLYIGIHVILEPHPRIDNGFVVEPPAVGVEHLLPSAAMVRSLRGPMPVVARPTSKQPAPSHA